ncbi:MAG: phosphoribosyltransferase [Blastocatellia bacterium]
MLRRFRDRTEAGQLLAEQLKEYANRSDVLVLALPRGGVPVGYEIARALNAPLDVLIVRKLGAPGQEELAMGAIASGGVRIMNETVLPFLSLTEEEIERIVAREQSELERREKLYRGDRPAPDARGKTVILVDDGIATGASMRSAVEAIRQRQPAKLIIAAPVAARSTCDEFNREADHETCVCLETPEPFFAVGLWYEDFAQTTDDEVRDLLALAAREMDQS